MEPMARPTKYSPEVRDRAIRRVREHGAEHPSQWAAIAANRPEAGLHDRDTPTLGATGGARHWPARGPHHRRTTAVERTGARERRVETRQRDPEESVCVFRTGGARPPSEVMVA